MIGQRIIRNLTRRGNRLLGVGAYSAALSSSDPSSAIKIGTNLSDPWLDYYHLIITKEVRSPYVPKVKHFMVNEAHEYFIATMERLHPITEDHWKLADAIRGYLSGEKDEADIAYEAQDIPEAVPCLDSLILILEKIKEHTEYNDRSEAIEDDNYEGTILDLHHGNIMLRADGCLVIIDPWCEAEISSEYDLCAWAEDVLKWED